MARALDQWWHELGEPDPFVVMEAGAGNGRLCREVLRAAPECAPALRYVLVERSAALRDAQRELLTVEPFEHALGPSTPDRRTAGCRSRSRAAARSSARSRSCPRCSVDGVVIANELLDNLAVRPGRARRRTAGSRSGSGSPTAGAFYEVPVPRVGGDRHAGSTTSSAPVGARLPVQRAVEEWIDDCAARLRRGVVLVLDYAAELDELVRRVRHPTARVAADVPGATRRGGDPLDDPGTQDITTDVLLPTLRRDARRAGFTVAHRDEPGRVAARVGIDELVEEGRRAWEAGAARGDLEALAGRSRITEAAALTDPAGLGAHTVLVLTTLRLTRPRLGYGAKSGAG